MEKSSGKTRTPLTAALHRHHSLASTDWKRRNGSFSTCSSLSSAENEENEVPSTPNSDLDSLKGDLDSLKEDSDSFKEEDIHHVPVRRLSAAVTIQLPQGPQKRNFPPPAQRRGRMSLPTISNGFGEDETLVFPRDIAWDWPFCNEGVARGVFTENKFMICLPFNNGGTGEGSGTTKKFEKISECNFSWTIGLSNAGDFGTGFWRMELEVIRNLNMLALIVSRDISRQEESAKRLKRVRKVYRLPDHYDIRTLTTTNYDFAIVLEASRRLRPRVKRTDSAHLFSRLRRSDSLCK